MAKGVRTSGSSGQVEDYPEKELTERIIGCAITVHKALGPGYLEAIYENALAHELTKQGFRVQRQLPAEVIYDGVVCGEHRLDILVEGKVVLELKNVDAIHEKHLAQVISTLKAFRARVGLLLNFNEAQLTRGLRRVILSDNQ